MLSSESSFTACFDHMCLIFSYFEPVSCDKFCVLIEIVWVEIVFFVTSKKDRVGIVSPEKF